MAQRGVDIDGMKLRKIFEQRGLTVPDVAKESGYLASSFSRALSNNRLMAQTTAFLKSRYSIDYDEYKPVEKVEVKVEPAKETPTTKEVFEELKDDIYKLIYAAVYEAVKKAWSE